MIFFRKSKILIHHGEQPEPNDNIYGFSFSEEIVAYTSNESEVKTLSQSDFVNLIKQSPGRILVPRIRDRIEALQAGIQQVDSKAYLNGSIALSPYYKCNAKFVAENPGFIALGLRGSEIKQFNIKQIRIGASNGNVHDPLLIDVWAVTNSNYGERGQQLLKLYESLLRQRMGEDGMVVDNK